MKTTTPQIVIFDMDGTLTLPAIDFDRLRAEIGIESGTILEALETMTTDERTRAYDIIEEHERVAARRFAGYGLRPVWCHCFYAVTSALSAGLAGCVRCTTEVAHPQTRA